MSELAIVKEIYFYPIKSVSGIKLDKCLVTKLGIAHPDHPDVIDRKWMIIDEQGNFLTQRQLPRMVLIKPQITDDYMILTANGKTDCKVPLKPTQNLIKCRVWNLKIDAYRYGGEISKWISEFLGRANLDLVNFDKELEPRKVMRVDEDYNMAREHDEAIFHDLSPFMLISEMSLNDLNSKLKEPVTIRNFRPNFFVTNCNAYSEDDWSKFSVGDAKFYKIKHCTRCLLTTVNPDQGVKNKEHEPLNTLKKYRLNKEMYGISPMFGINIVLDNKEGTIISVGDQIVSLSD